MERWLSDLKGWGLGFLGVFFLILPSEGQAWGKKKNTPDKSATHQSSPRAIDAAMYSNTKFVNLSAYKLEPNADLMSAKYYRLALQKALKDSGAQDSAEGERAVIIADLGEDNEASPELQALIDKQIAKKGLQGRHVLIVNAKDILSSVEQDALIKKKFNLWKSSLRTVPEESRMRRFEALRFGDLQPWAAVSFLFKTAMPRVWLKNRSYFPCWL